MSTSPEKNPIKTVGGVAFMWIVDKQTDGRKATTIGLCKSANGPKNLELFFFNFFNIYLYLKKVLVIVIVKRAFYYLWKRKTKAKGENLRKWVKLLLGPGLGLG